jgi:hypothetical protein
LIQRRPSTGSSALPFYGADYKLTGFGNADHFFIGNIGWFKANGNKYKGTANLDISVTFTE